MKFWQALWSAFSNGVIDNYGSSSPQFRLTTAEQRADFARDGYIVVRGLLNRTMVQGLRHEGESYMDYLPGGNSQATRIGLNSTSLFSQLALCSDIPTIVAELMQLDPQSQNLRLIHDFFFCRNYTDVARCDWHVDGHGLWPESLETPSKASQRSGHDQDGINAWVALDDMPAQFQGSMAVSAGSHRAPWRYKALRAIGRPGDQGNGGETWEETVNRMASGQGMVPQPDGTSRIRLCSMGVTAPDLYAKCEEQKRILDLQAGDVVLCSRSLFHRTLQVTPQGLQHYEKQLDGRSGLGRYTIRYTVGSAELPTGFCWLEWSVLMHPEIAGLSLNQVEEMGLPYWFPQVWPNRPSDLLERLKALAPHIQAARDNLQTVQKKLLDEVAQAKAKITSDEATE